MKKKNLALVLGMMLAIPAMNPFINAVEAAKNTPADVSISVAKDLLNKGNANYLANDKDQSLRKDLLVNGQHPYSVVITCSDSRAIPERVFNANFGEIFTIRTAGNVISDFELASVEYGAEHLGTPLVVVMGHTNCGAVTSACAESHEGAEQTALDRLVNEIRPSVEKAKANGSTKETLLNDAIVLNIEHSISKIRESHVIKHLEEEGKVKIIGAVYNIETGKVKFLE